MYRSKSAENVFYFIEPFFSRLFAVGIFFIITLESFLQHRYTALFFLIAASFIFFVKWARIKPVDLYVVFIQFFVVFMFILINSTNIEPFKVNSSQTAQGLFLSLATKLLFFVPVYLLCDRSVVKLHSVVGMVCWLHFLFFCIQYFLVYGFHIYLDPLHYFTGIEQKYHSGLFVPIIGQIFRPSGFYLEPSTYSSFMLVLVAIRVSLLKKTTVIDFLVLFSSVLSFSTAAAGLSSISIFLVVYASEYRRLLIKWFFLLAPVMLYVVYASVFLRLSLQSGDVTSTALRLGLIGQVFSQAPSEIMFGNGFLGFPDSLAHLVKSESLADQGFAAINDGGLWLFIIMKIGVIGFLIFVGFFYSALRNFISFCFFILALMTKVSLFDPTFIFYMSAVIFSRYGSLK